MRLAIYKMVMHPYELYILVAGIWELGFIQAGIH